MTFFDSSSGLERPQPLSPITGTIIRMRFSPDGKWLAAAGYDGFIYFIQTDTMEIKHWWNLEASFVMGLNWSPDGNSLAVSTRGPSTVAVWKLR